MIAQYLLSQLSLALPKIEKRSYDWLILLQIQSSPSIHPLEPATILAWLSPNDLPFAEGRLRGVDGPVSILEVCTVLPAAAYYAKDPRAAFNC